MKKIMYTILTIYVLLLSSCSSENNNDFQDNQSNIISTEITKREITQDEFDSTNYYLNTYNIVVLYTDGWCSYWNHKEILVNNYRITISNQCNTLKGIPYFNIDGFAVRIEDYIINDYIFDISDQNTLDILGIEFEVIS